MVVFNNIIAGASGATSGAAAGFKIDRSLRFNSADSAYLSRTPSSAGNRRTWTWSGWVKRSKDSSSAKNDFFGAGGNGFMFGFDNGTQDVLRIEDNFYTGALAAKTTAVFRDYSAWYHIVLSIDTTQSSSANGIRLWVNNKLQTLTSIAYTQNYETIINSTTEHFVGGNSAWSSRDFNGYLADVHFIDGQALAPTDFGEYDDNNVWQPIEYTGSYDGFDTSQDWSSLATTSDVATNAGNDIDSVFDGRLDTGIRAANIGDTGVIQFSSGTFQGNVRVHTSLAGSPGALVYFDGVTQQQVSSPANDGWNDLGNIDLTELRFLYPSSGNVLFVGGIEVDGVLKVNSDVTGLVNNGFHLDFSDNSSNAALGYDAAGSNDWTVNNLSALSDAYTASSYRENTGAINQTWNNSNAASATSSSLDEDEIFWVDLGSTVSTDLIKFDVTITGTDTNANNYSVYYTTDPASVGSNTYSSFSRSAGGTTGSFTMTLSGSSAISGRYFGIVNGNGGTSATFVYSNFQVYPVTKECDSLIDTPTNYTAASGNNGGNYATLNPLDSNIGSNLTNGNLDAAGSSNWSAGHARGTLGLTSGKWYWEVTRTGGSGATAQIGFCNKAFSLTTSYASLPADSWTFAFGNGTEILRPSGGGTSYFSGSAMGVGDTAGIALDMDNQTAVFYKNGTAGATIDLSATSTGGTDNIDELFPLVGVYNANVVFNFGQRPFAYTPPTGYLSLCTQNLTDPTIADGSTAMDVVTYTGDNGTNRAITGLNMSPDFVWIKQRSDAGAHMLFDAVRGATKRLVSNQNLAEGTVQGVTSFDSNGFTLGNDADCNLSPRTHVAWAWDAGTGSPVSNTDGSITSSVLANASAGFSIVSYDGGNQAETVGHGLNAAPELIIAKARNAALGWKIYHSALGVGGFLEFDTGAFFSVSNYWGSSITSSTFGISAGGDIAVDGMIAYCFAPVEGYSAFGSYTGNGSADGPFVFLGFRPKYLLFKNITTSGWQWFVWDTSRDPYNDVEKYIEVSTAVVEGTYSTLDILSNGFKLRTTSGSHNANADDYVYIAFAEHPFKTARAR